MSQNWDYEQAMQTPEFRAAEKQKAEDERRANPSMLLAEMYKDTILVDYDEDSQIFTTHTGETLPLEEVLDYFK